MRWGLLKCPGDLKMSTATFSHSFSMGILISEAFCGAGGLED